MHKVTAKRKVLLHDGKSSLSRDNTRRNHKINTTVPSRKHHAITQSSCSNSDKHHHAPGRKPCMRAEKEQESCTAPSHAINSHRITEGPKHRYKIRKKQQRKSELSRFRRRITKKSSTQRITEASDPSNWVRTTSSETIPLRRQLEECSLFFM